MSLDHLAAEHRRMLENVLDRARALELRAMAHLFGRRPDHPKLGHRTTHTPKIALADHLASEASAPAHVHRGLFTGYTDILGNDQWGDCGDAMTLHGIEGFHHAAGTPVPAFTTADALGLYSEVSGFDPNAGPPGDNPTDRGTDNDQLVSYWQNTGVRCQADGSVHKIVGTVAINPANTVECQVAVYEFAALFVAVALPQTAQGQHVWQVVGDGQTGASAPGSWGGHDVVAMAYDEGTLDVDTWGLWTPMTEGFRQDYGIGFFAVVTQEMLGRTGVSPTGLNWSTLTADFRKL